MCRKNESEGSIIGIPLKFNDNVVGVMTYPNLFQTDSRLPNCRLLGLLADQAAVAIFNASLAPNGEARRHIRIP